MRRAGPGGGSGENRPPTGCGINNGNSSYMILHRISQQSLRRLCAVLFLPFPFAVLSQTPHPFPVPLAKLSPSFDQFDGSLKSVRIQFENEEDYTVLAPYTDYRVRQMPLGKEKIIHPEMEGKAHILSDFEAEQLLRVSDSFTETLEKFDKMLKRKKWGNCLYLDAYFPRFLKGFWYLYNAARCRTALKTSALVADSLYELSQNSEKSRARIQAWKRNPDQIIRLRLASEELAYQIKKWQKKELRQSRQKRETASAEKFELAFELFIGIYFNLPSTEGGARPRDGRR
jgi:hypothetical protein